MTISEALALFADSADGELLLSDLFSKDRTWIFSHHEAVLSGEQEMKIRDYATRRSNGEPVAYLRGKQDFYGRTFSVSPATLIPRPATEGLIELAREWKERPFDVVRAADTDIVVCGIVLRDLQNVNTFVDVGTGSGCIAITLFKEMPGTTIIATDNSKDALAIARRNAEVLGASDITFHEGHLLDPLEKLNEPFIIVSNPPYIPLHTELDRSVTDFEPHQALFADEKGTSILFALIDQAKKHPYCAGLLVECRADQVADIAARAS